MIGNSLGPYRILSQIGLGGMGEVYRARDERLGREVAIKILPAAFAADPERMKRFEREARLTASISHPNILTLYDVGSQDGLPYLVEELLAGESLKKRLNRGALPLKDVIGFTLKFAQGLSAAHEKGVVHRDLKPANLFITTDGQFKILDFGLAKERGIVAADSASTLDEPSIGETKAGTVLGTAGYMAPEQVRGHPADQRSDVFSFGCVVYEMLTGKRAFLGENAISTMSAILEKTPQPPREIVPTAPAELERIILTCLEKDSAKRFQSAVALRQELQSGALWAGKLEALETRPSTRRLFTSKRSLLLLFSALLLIMGTLFVVKRLTRQPIPERKNLAVLPFIALGGGQDQIYCDGMTETVTTKLAGIGSLQVLPVSQVMERKTDTPEKARRELGANLVLRATWQRSGARVRINMALLESARGLALRTDSITAPGSDLFSLQDQVVTGAVQMLELALRADETKELGSHGTQQPSAYDYYLRGVGYLQDYTKLGNITSAVSVFNQALQQDPHYSLAFSGLGQAYWRGYLLTHQPGWLDDALNACRRSLEADSRSANAYACLGVVYNEKGEYALAVAELEHAVRLNHSSDDFLRSLARTYQNLGKIADAEKALKNATALRPQYWGNYSYLGAFYFSRGRYREATEMFQQVIKLAPDSFRGYYNLGGAYLAMDRLDEAIPVLERSIQIWPTAAAYSNLSIVYLTRRQFAEAARVLEKALKLEWRYVFWGNLGEAWFFTPGKNTESIRAFQQATQLARARLRDNPNDADALSRLAYFEAMTGENDSAKDHIQQLLRRESLEAPQLIYLAKASSRLGDDKQTISLIEKALAAGEPVSAITDAPHFDLLRARSELLRELLLAKSRKE